MLAIAVLTALAALVATTVQAVARVGGVELSAVLWAMSLWLFLNGAALLFAAAMGVAARIVRPPQPTPSWVSPRPSRSKPAIALMLIAVNFTLLVWSRELAVALGW